MSRVLMTSFLRKVFLADAAVSVATGGLMLFGSSALQPLLNLPAGLLVVAGLSLFGYAAGVLWMARRRELPRSAVWLVIGINGVWAIDCAVLGVGGAPWVGEPSLLGQLFLAANVVTVLAFAELQFMGLRRGSSHQAALA